MKERATHTLPDTAQHETLVTCHPAKMNFVTKETLAKHSHLEGKLVTATCANTNTKIYGKVLRVRECIDNYQNGGVRYLCDIENAGNVKVAYASTVEVTGN